MVLDNDGVYSKTTKEKVKSLDLKAKVTREQTSDDSDRVAIGLVMAPIGLEEAAKIALGTKAVKARDKRDNLGCSDSEDGDEPQNNATCLMATDYQEVQPKPSISKNDLDIIDLQKENEELLRFNKDFTNTLKRLLKENSPLRIVRSQNS
ncbi:hypothetical protein Tco_1475735 [Tanacetum coccineum]